MKSAVTLSEHELLSPELTAYLERWVPERDPILRSMEERAEREGFPIVGPLVGQLLQLLAQSISARHVFEMGSGFGYSALWFAKALLPGGNVTLTDTSQEHSAEAKAYFRQAGQERKAQCLVGDAVTLIGTVRGPFDVIFVDTEKSQYPEAFKAAWSKLRSGGLLIADNVLWGGRVLGRRMDADTRGIVEFTRLITGTPGAFTSLIPLRDGVSVTLKVR